MKTGKKLSSLILLTILILLPGLTALGDTIRLKNGSVIKGRVISFSQQEFIVVLDLGAASRSTTRMTIAAADIESIEFDGTGGTTPPETAAMTQTPAGKYGEGQRNTQAENRPATQPTEPVAEPENNPPPTTPPVQEPAAPEVSSPAAASIIEKTVSVPASLDWTSTEIRVQRGQRIRITASGEIDLGNGTRSTPGGIGQNDTNKLIRSKATGALIAVVGDDNDDFEFVGNSTEFTARHNGILFLSVNEGNLKDNSGSYLARVRVMPVK